MSRSAKDKPDIEFSVSETFETKELYQEEDFSGIKVILNNLSQGSVVQSIVGLTSSLRGQLVKCLTTL